MSKTRVEATHEKIALLQEMQGMINTLKKYAARIDDKIAVMIAADLESMTAEKDALDKMEKIIKKDGNGKKG